MLLDDEAPCNGQFRVSPICNWTPAEQALELPLKYARDPGTPKIILPLFNSNRNNQLNRTIRCFRFSRVRLSNNARTRSGSCINAARGRFHPRGEHFIIAQSLTDAYAEISFASDERRVPAIGGRGHLRGRAVDSSMCARMMLQEMVEGGQGGKRGDAAYRRGGRGVGWRAVCRPVGCRDVGGEL